MGALKSVKQEKFCQLYAATGNATQSFKDAGYNVSSNGAAGVRAHDLLKKNSNIQKRLQELADEAKTEAIADIQEMHSFLTSVIREQSDEEKLMSVGTGEGFSEIVSKRQKASLKDRLKAVELLAKMQGAFDNRLKVEVELPTFIGEGDLED